MIVTSWAKKNSIWPKAHQLLADMNQILKCKFSMEGMDQFCVRLQALPVPSDALNQHQILLSLLIKVPN